MKVVFIKCTQLIPFGDDAWDDIEEWAVNPAYVIAIEPYRDGVAQIRMVTGSSMFTNNTVAETAGHLGMLPVNVFGLGT
tara:strand:+ start:271 stop:507 length:237 start_codon:yes stop_codon:yes gene_type:complete